MATETRNKELYRPQRKKRINASGVVTEDITSNKLFGRDYDSRTHVTRRKKPKGWLPPRAYSRTVKTGCTFGYSSFYQYGKRSDNVQYFTSGTEDYARASEIDLPSFDGDLSSKAVLAARLNLKNQKVDFSVAFAERKQTADLFSSVTTRIATAIDAVRHRDLKKAKKALGISPKITRRERKLLKKMPPKRPGERDSVDAASNLWLENAYGVQPLLADVRGSAETLAQNDIKDPTRYRTKVTGTRSSKTDTWTTSYPDSHYGVPYVETVNTNTYMSAFVRLDFCLEQPMLAQASSLGFTNPLQTGWEKIPFSFVADWLYPIGDYISSMDATLGYEFLGGSLSELTRRTVKYFASARSVSGWKSINCGGFGSCKLTRLSRSPYITVPVPALVKPKNPLSMGHVANALALLRQACS